MCYTSFYLAGSTGQTLGTFPFSVVIQAVLVSHTLSSCLFLLRSLLKDCFLRSRVQHLTKGKMIEVAGQQIEPSAWNGKDGNPHAQVVILASFIKFVPFGKKQGGQDSEQEQNAPENNVPDTNAGMPFKAPDDKADDLPF